MLTDMFSFLDPAHISSDLAGRLRALADDCEQLKLAQGVPPMLLRRAPLLKNWVPALTPGGVQLIGYTVGHPIHGDRMVMTTPLWWADPDGTWVRSLSRFYRLGPPAGPDEVRRMLALAVSAARRTTHEHR
ncbi:DUF6634 family protein [Bradyrhizobium sp. 174]|uniref:DUF6634 family protein n=1 Tax=Bradyrhizobium sp. 174 TaxID=2782645 RepID=UPI001FF80BE5|nr:DUF6634 family protein [Bradyrhizobium sp. 174]MCK1576836.1 hypothetical protein [Bradyrhizobium sp. 174]